MTWTKESIESLEDIDLMYLGGDAIRAQSFGWNPYGDESVAAMIAECVKRGITVLIDDDNQPHPMSELKVQGERNMEELNIDQLDELLVNERKRCLDKWPYAFDQKVRDVEAEYKRRGEPLPENRQEGQQQLPV